MLRNKKSVYLGIVVQRVAPPFLKENMPKKINTFPATKSDIQFGKLKETNPKDLVGTSKAPMSTVSAAVMAEIGVAMLEGACKYGRHNYRSTGVRASVYYDATMRHLMTWWEGEDIDPDSQMSHVTKAITSLVVLRDSMIQGMMTDDRAPIHPVLSIQFHQNRHRQM